MRRSRRFSSSPCGTPIKSVRVVAIKPLKCAHCGLAIPAGEEYYKVTFKKRYRVPCAQCHQPPKSRRRYHLGCLPVDLNAAMGYDPTGRAHAVVAPAPQIVYQPAPVPSSHKVAPPPVPQTFTEATLGALAAFEVALKRRLAEDPALTRNADLAATLKTYNACKQRALRPGTDAEGVVGLKMSLKKVVDLIF